LGDGECLLCPTCQNQAKKKQTKETSHLEKLALRERIFEVEGKDERKSEKET
jgi:hypothetical protein